MVEKQVMLTPSKITAWLECEHYLTLKINDELQPKKEWTKEVAAKQELNSGLMAPPEDFADMLKHVKGAYCRIGHKGTQPLHSPKFILDPEIIPVGASVLARLVEKQLPTD